MYKKLFISCLMMFFSQLSLAQTNQPKDSLRESEVFGLLLGIDSLDDVAKKTKNIENSSCTGARPRSSCRETYEIVEDNTLEYKNKVYHIYNSDDASLKYGEVEYITINFEISEVKFYGIFFENKLISLDTRINYSDFSEIKKSFDKKYNKKPTGIGKGEYKIDEDTTYKFHRWIDKKSIFEVQITESTSFFNTISECIVYQKKLYNEYKLEATFKEFQDRCKNKKKHTFVDLSYRSVQFYPQMMNKVVEKILEKEKLKLMENHNKKNKNTQKINKF